MKTILNDCAFISNETNKDLIIFKNPIDDTVSVFVFVELNHRTANTPYHELIGLDITAEVERLNDQTFDPERFERELEKKLMVNIRCPENTWLWIRARPA